MWDTAWDFIFCTTYFSKESEELLTAGKQRKPMAVKNSSSTSFKQIMSMFGEKYQSVKSVAPELLNIWCVYEQLDRFLKNSNGLLY